MMPSLKRNLSSPFSWYNIMMNQVNDYATGLSLTKRQIIAVKILVLYRQILALPANP